MSNKDERIEGGNEDLKRKNKQSKKEAKRQSKAEKKSSRKSKRESAMSVQVCGVTDFQWVTNICDML